MLSERAVRRLNRIPGATRLWSRFQWGPLNTRVEYGVWQRPPYAYGVFHAADQARRLGLPGISVLELGVAGGRGLLALERIAKGVGEHFGLPISVYGFDTGEGMPPPVDYRDVAHVWNQGFYKMDQSKLKAQLTSAQLVLGDVRETIPAFVASGNIDPIGFIAFDLDYHSSTRSAFELFDGPAQTRLPRVYTYFDDIVWPASACYNDYIGELCAIREFNEEHDLKKLCPIHMLEFTLPVRAQWQGQIYVMHDFGHPRYTTNLTPRDDKHTELPLDDD